MGMEELLITWFIEKFRMRGQIENALVNFLASLRYHSDQNWPRAK